MDPGYTPLRLKLSKVYPNTAPPLSLSLLFYQGLSPFPSFLISLSYLSTIDEQLLSESVISGLLVSFLGDRFRTFSCLPPSVSIPSFSCLWFFPHGLPSISFRSPRAFMFRSAVILRLSRLNFLMRLCPPHPSFTLPRPPLPPLFPLEEPDFPLPATPPRLLTAVELACAG